jgi:hypothetical protein
MNKDKFSDMLIKPWAEWNLVARFVFLRSGRTLTLGYILGHGTDYKELWEIIDSDKGCFSGTKSGCINIFNQVYTEGINRNSVSDMEYGRGYENSNKE